MESHKSFKFNQEQITTLGSTIDFKIYSIQAPPVGEHNAAMSTPIQQEGAPKILSRKLLSSIESSLVRLSSGAFSEADIKLLIIELREYAGDMNGFLKDLQAPEELREATLDFGDVCNFIAHPDRNRGRMEANIRELVFKLHDVYKATGSIDYGAVTLDKVFRAHRVVDTMISLSMLALAAAGRPVNEKTSVAIKGCSTEIELCLMSILQDARIELIDKGGKVSVDGGYATLQLMVSHGKYTLFCSVIDSPIERDLRKTSGGKGTLSLGFAVMGSQIYCADPLLLESNPGERPAPLFMFERDEGKVLQLRRIG